jgi:serine/threonine protein phosphatase PrpC
MGRIPGVRKTNQDNYIIEKDFTGIKNCWMLGVHDGHGEHGHHVSEFIRMVLPKIISNLAHGNPPMQNVSIKNLGASKLGTKPVKKAKEEAVVISPPANWFLSLPEDRDLLIKESFTLL